MEKLLLAGDVGGTKTILAAFRPEAESEGAVAEATFENRRYEGLNAVVTEFLDRFAVRVDQASFSVAGPVAGGRSVLTNLGWSVDEAELRETFGLRAAYLLNDLRATAFAVPMLPATRMITLQSGVPIATGVCAVIAPGTGLGEAFLQQDGGHIEAWPSEGGNADFAPADEVQIELLRFLQRRIGHVSVEHVCSGIGIPNIYDFLKESGAAEEPAWLAERLAAVTDPTPVIGEAALRGDADCTLCTRTMELFVEILAAEAGNMALRLLATGGVYIAGGIPPRVLPLLLDARFIRAFRHKGRFAEMMETFPVHVILDPRAPLLGAAHYAVTRPVVRAEPPVAFPPPTV